MLKVGEYTEENVETLSVIKKMSIYKFCSSSSKSREAVWGNAYDSYSKTMVATGSNYIVGSLTLLLLWWVSILNSFRNSSHQINDLFLDFTKNKLNSYSCQTKFCLNNFRLFAHLSCNKSPLVTNCNLIFAIYNFWKFFKFLYFVPFVCYCSICYATKKYFLYHYNNLMGSFEAVREELLNLPF